MKKAVDQTCFPTSHAVLCHVHLVKQAYETAVDAISVRKLPFTQRVLSGLQGLRDKHQVPSSEMLVS
jgi:hypothetical protein